jgi:mRNA-degrading endonuclease RelE of RelBE toxin-antitoxin system
VYSIVYTERADRQLAELRAYDQVRIVDEIDDHLSRFPNLPTVRRKILRAVIPSFEHVPPVWQLRVDTFRVIYDVDLQSRTVTIRAILFKGNTATKEIL